MPFPPPGPGARNRSRGVASRLPARHSAYTAIELMVVIALIAIITAAALPYFSFWVDRWRVNQAVAHLQNVMRFTNAQAIRTNSDVIIQAKPATCRLLQDSKNWSCGLTIFQDTNQNNVRDTDEPVLREEPEFHAVTIMHAGGNNAYLKYGSHGAPIANPSRFEVYPSANPGSQAAQTICLSFGGKMRVVPGLSCPN